MDRRQFSTCSVSALGLWILTARAQAAVSSEADASAGLKAALERGAAAVSLLGKPDGFLGDPCVRIPLPASPWPAVSCPS